MFAKNFGRILNANRYLSLGLRVWWGIGLLFGVTVSCVMAWMLAQVSWYWSTFGWAGVPVAALLAFLLISLSVALWRLRPDGVPKQHDSPKPPVRVELKIFRNERIHIDGRHYDDCDFYNVTLVYNGGPAGMHACRFHGIVLASDRPEIEAAMTMLQASGLLQIPIGKGHTMIPPGVGLASASPPKSRP